VAEQRSSSGELWIDRAELFYCSAIAETVSAQFPSGGDEQFGLVRQQALQMVENFSAVEVRFKEPVDDIQKKTRGSTRPTRASPGSGTGRRSWVVKTDHGQSFEAFCHLLIALRQRRCQ
jgi:hypothetical protein